MNDIRSRIRRSPIIQRVYFGLRLDEIEHRLSNSWEKSIDESLKIFLTQDEIKDPSISRSIKRDINRCYHQIRTNPTEYFMFDLRYKSKDERKTYLSDKVILSELTKKGQRYIHDTELHDKYNFYKLNKQWFKRDVIEVSNENDYEVFKEMALKNKEIIIKPDSSACGMGIFSADINNQADADVLFKKLMGEGVFVIEKRLRQSKEMAEWNGSSVNTVRIITYRKNNSTTIDTHPFFRTGRAGCVADNAGVGGVYALLDIENGEVITDGMDERHNSYLVHPDSKKIFKGSKIPDFDILKKLAVKIHEENMPKHLMIGWDFAHTDDGWVLIEGNWGTCVCQQSQLKRGLKSEFLENIGA